ncbi:hypothetical protein V8C86DRAFT_2761212 [Haematococcus lacustris]
MENMRWLEADDSSRRGHTLLCLDQPCLTALFYYLQCFGRARHHRKVISVGHMCETGMPFASSTPSIAVAKQLAMVQAVGPHVFFKHDCSQELLPAPDMPIKAMIMDMSACIMPHSPLLINCNALAVFDTIASSSAHLSLALACTLTNQVRNANSFQQRRPAALCISLLTHVLKPVVQSLTPGSGNVSSWARHKAGRKGLSCSCLLPCLEHRLLRKQRQFQGQVLVIKGWL